jgi:hypothetical protein
MPVSKPLFCALNFNDDALATGQGSHSFRIQAWMVIDEAMQQKRLAAIG